MRSETVIGTLTSTLMLARKSATACSASRREGRAFTVPRLRFLYVRLPLVSSYQRNTHTSGPLCAFVSRDFLVESDSCCSPSMSVDGCIYRTRRASPFRGDSASLHPLQQLMLHKTP